METPNLLDPLERANINHCLALSKGQNRVGVSLFSPEDGNISSFRNIFGYYLEFQMMDTVQDPSNFECYISLSESFSFY
jgi:hypothetical protein